MRRWQSEIDKKIEEMLRNTPQTGKPLKKTDENPYVPQDQRTAHKIMQDHNVPPEWIALGKTLEKKEAKLRNAIQRAVKTYRQMLADADQRPAFKANAEQAWQAAQRNLRAQAESYNNELLSYNLKVPPSVGQRRKFDLEKELQKALRI